MTSPIRSKPESSTTPVPRRFGRFTNTAVPKFNGSVCWYQVFDAIAKSNGWDGETAALRLFAHLNVALLLPDDQRATRSGLSGALSEYYNYPGRLAIYRQKRVNVVRRDGHALSVFAMEL